MSYSRPSGPPPPHRYQEIQELFGRKIRRPWLGRLIPELEELPESVAGVNLGVSWWAKVYRRATRWLRYRAAAYEWLKPEGPSHHGAPGLAGIPDIKALVRIDHYTDSAFAEGVKRRALKIRDKHPELRPWIDCRLALLEGVTNPFTRLGPDFRELEVTLRSQERLAYALLHQGRLEAAEQAAHDLSTKALGAVAAICAKVLGPPTARKPRLHANLMLPIPKRGPLTGADVGLKTRLQPAWGKNVAAADELWKDVAPEGTKCLQVISETNPVQHGGFWIPVLKGDNEGPMPGAATAYLRMHGSAVFTRDLPPLAGFPGWLEQKWHLHLRQRFDYEAFVSLPLTMPSAAGLAVAAVVNVNVDFKETAPWLRAYHDDWLDVAEEQVADFAEIAYHAAIVHLSAHASRQGQSLRLATAGELLLPLMPDASLSGNPVHWEGSRDREEL